MKKVVGFIQSAVITVGWVLFGYTFFKNAVAAPQWGPLVGGAFGCFAISIAIQQAYAWSTEPTQSAERAVYLWSSATLLLLGSGTVVACLPNELQLPFANST